MAEYAGKWRDAEQEKNVIAVFLDKLEVEDKVHFQELFNYLFTVSDAEIQKYCHAFTVSQKLKFFKKRPKFFLVQEDYVSKSKALELLSCRPYKKLCSSVRFILQCFGPLHFFEVRKHITFLFEDVVHYMIELLPGVEEEIMRSIPNVNVDNRGVLTLASPRKVGSKYISSEEKCLLAFVVYLRLHGRTHFKKSFEELVNLAKKEFVLVFGKRSDSERLRWLKQQKNYFEVSKDGFLELIDYSEFECDYQMLKCDQFALQNSRSQSNDVGLNGSVPSGSNPTEIEKTVASSNHANTQTLKDLAVKFSVNTKFQCAVTFLVKCSNPVHYSELKECIVFTMGDVVKGLRELPSSELPDIFKKVPFTLMDDNGFLHLSEPCDSFLSFELEIGCVLIEDMIKLFIVYYLGYHGKTHFAGVIKEIVSRAPKSVSCVVSGLSAPEQLNYLKQFGQYFQINEKNELEVDSSFTLPKCEYIGKEQTKFNCSVMFLVSCFDPLHYYELRECITFTMDDVAKFLKGLPLFTPLEMFKKVPFTKMDNNGFLHLTDSCDAFLLSELEKGTYKKEEMINIFIVYYLGFCGKTKIIKIIEELVGRTPEAFSCVLSKLTLFKQSKYLNQYIHYFTTNKRGELELNSSFSLPICKYEETVSDSVSVKEGSSDKKDNVQSNKQKSRIEPAGKLLPGSKLTVKRISCGIAYLMKFFRLKQTFWPIRVILHILKDARALFQDSSDAYQTDLLKEIFSPFFINEKNVISSVVDRFEFGYLTEKEMDHLYFSYLFFYNGQMHYRQAMKRYLEHNGKALRNVRSESDQYWYFKYAESIFTIGTNGYVNTRSLPSLKLSAKLLFDILKSDKKVASKLPAPQYPLNDSEQLKSNIMVPESDVTKIVDSPEPESDVTKIVDSPEIQSPQESNSLKDIDKCSETKEVKLINDDRLFNLSLCTSAAARTTSFSNLTENVDSSGHAHLTVHSDLQEEPSTTDKCIASSFPSLERACFTAPSSFQEQPATTDNCSVPEFTENDVFSLSKENSSKDIWRYPKLFGAASFLLGHFNSLYYINVKEIISFVLTDVGKFWNELPLDKQDEIFKDIPNITMDKNGYLRLTTTASNLFDSYITKDKKQALFIVCYLVLNGSTPYTEIIERTKDIKGINLNELTSSQQRSHFENLSEYFETCPDEYLRLHSTFVFSACGKSQHQTHESNLTEKVQSVNKLSSPNNVKLYQDGLASESPMSKKIQDGVVHLSQHFNLTLTSNFLPVILLVLDGVETFNHLSTSAKVAVLKRSLLPFKVDKNEVMSVISLDKLQKSSLCEAEREELLMAYIVFQQKEVHFLKVFREFSSKNVTALSCNTSNTSSRFYYFKEREHIFYIGNDGFVKLVQLPSLNLDSNTLQQCITFRRDLDKLSAEFSASLPVPSKEWFSFTDMKGKNAKQTFKVEDTLNKEDPSKCKSDNEILTKPLGSSPGIDVNSKTSSVTDLNTSSKHVMDIIDKTASSSDNEAVVKDDSVKNNAGIILKDSENFNEQSCDNYVAISNSVDLPACDKLPQNNEECTVSVKKDEQPQNLPKFLNHELYTPDKRENKGGNLLFLSIFRRNKNEYGFKIAMTTKIRDSVLYLLPHFNLKATSSFLQLILLVLGDFENFSRLSTAGKVAVLKQSFLTFRVDEESRISLTSLNDWYKSCLCESEKKELLMAFIVFQHNVVHFSKAFQELSKYNIMVSWNTSERFRYFSERKNMFCIGNDGYVIMAELPPIDLDVNTLLQCFTQKPLEHKNRGLTKTLHPSGRVIPPSNALKTEKVLEQSGEKEEVFMKLVGSITFLLDYFDVTVDWHILCLVFRVMEEVRHGYFSLAEDDQSKILKRVIQHFKIPKEAASMNKQCLDMYKPNEEQENLLFMVFILSGEERLHYRKLFDKFTYFYKDAPACVHTDSDAHRYIKSRSRVFILKDGYVKLRPLPPREVNSRSCSWTNSKVSKTNLIDVKAKTPSSLKGNRACSERKGNAVVKSDSGRNRAETVVKDCVSIDPKKIEFLSQRIQASILYLLEYYRLTAETQLLKIIFQALEDNKVYFNLPVEDQKDFLKKCFRVFVINKDGVISLAPANAPKIVELKDKRKVLLRIMYLLSQLKTLYYRKIFLELGDQVSVPPTDKEQYKYFQNQADIFSIAQNGYVKLHNLPDIKMNLSEFRNLFQSSKTESSSMVNKPASNCETSKSKISPGTESETCSTDQRPDCSSNGIVVSKVVSTNQDKSLIKLSCDDSQILEGCVSEEKISQISERISNGIFFLSNYFKLTPGPHLVCVLLHALEDVRKYFSKLPTSYHPNFVRESLSCLNPDSRRRISNVSSLLDMGDNEKDVLFLTYILSHVNEMHCREIFDMYAMCNKSKPNGAASYIDLKPYISERRDIFSLNLDGYVKLNRQFVVGQNFQILCISCISPNAKILNPPVDCALDHGLVIINQLPSHAGTSSSELVSSPEPVAKCSLEQDDNLQYSNYIQLMCELTRESITFLNNRFKTLPQHHAVRAIYHVLDDFRNLDSSDREKVNAAVFDVDAKSDCPPPQNTSLEFLKLSEEEKDLMIISCILMQWGPLHYSELFKQFEKPDHSTWKSMTTKGQYQYIHERSKYFYITDEGIVNLRNMSGEEHSTYNQLMCELTKESITFLNNQFKTLTHHHAMRAIYRVLDGFRNLDPSGREKVNATVFDVDSKNNSMPLKNTSLEFLKLSEEEKNLMIISCILMQWGPLHYSELFKQFEKHDGSTWKSMISKYQYQYIHERSKYFYITDEGIVNLSNISFENTAVVSNSLTDNAAAEILEFSEASCSESESCTGDMLDSFVEDIGKSKYEVTEGEACANLGLYEDCSKESESSFGDFIDSLDEDIGIITNEVAEVEVGLNLGSSQDCSSESEFYVGDLIDSLVETIDLYTIEVTESGSAHLKPVESSSSENESLVEKRVDPLVATANLRCLQHPPPLLSSADINVNKLCGSTKGIPSHEPECSLSELLVEKETSCLCTDQTNASLLNIDKLPDPSKTELEQKCVNFFTILLGNVKMADALEDYLHLASKDVQNHIKNYYHNNINNFLRNHEILPTSSIGKVRLKI